MDKKPYTPPQVTKHGNAVEMTAGEHGRALEFINFRVGTNVTPARGR
ncbi:MAG TPA: hypothetical protein VFJ16_13255 [Longimicrobium sp.]|nr:hypothetical protein [Longimicrobium sp.]